MTPSDKTTSTGPGFGYGPADHAKHRHDWSIGQAAGMALMYCDCGESYLLCHTAGGEHYWREIDIVTSASVAQALSDLQASGESRPVPPQSGPARWLRHLLRRLPKGAQS